MCPAVRRDVIIGRFSKHKRENHPGVRRRDVVPPTTPSSIQNGHTSPTPFSKFRKGLGGSLFKGDPRYIHPPRPFTARGTGTRSLLKKLRKTFKNGILYVLRPPPQAGLNHWQIFEAYARKSSWSKATREHIFCTIRLVHRPIRSTCIHLKRQHIPLPILKVFAELFPQKSDHIPAAGGIELMHGFLRMQKGILEEECDAAISLFGI